MSEGETFLARWSRLKREQTTAPSTTHALPVERAGEPATPAPPVDLAGLPSIESLGPGSDMSAYLKTGVPWELAQSALRSAWRVDPAVRDFVEIADNQWDFNTPEAIPGFGALGAAEEATARVARAATGAESMATTVAALTPGTDQACDQGMTAVPFDESRVVDPVWQAGATLPVSAAPTSVEMPEGALEADATTPGRRVHGSALPK